MAYVNQKAVQVFRPNESGSQVTLYPTESFCEICSELVKARVFEQGGKVFLEKDSCCLGKETVLRENDSAFYKRSLFLTPPRIDPPKGKVKDCGKYATQLFKIFLTPKCDARCQVCLMDWQMGRDETGQRRVEFTPASLEDVLSRGKIEGKELIISGGEPAVRDDLPEIVKIGKKHNNKVCVYSNGKRMAKDKKFVARLAKAGLDSVQISFDSVKEEFYPKAKGESGLLKRKLSAMRNLEAAGIPVILSPTIMAGYNEKQVGALLDFAIKRRKNVRQLLYRPFAPIGRAKISVKGAITPSDIMKEIDSHTKGKVSVEAFFSFMEMRMAIFKAIYRLFGQKTAYGFSWGRGYSILLKVGKEGGYEPYFSVEECKKTTSEISKALSEKTTAGFVRAIVSAIPKVSSNKKFSLLAGLVASSGRKARTSMYNMWKMDDIFQLHIADPFYRMTADTIVQSNVYDIVRYEEDGKDLKVFENIDQPY